MAYIPIIGAPQLPAPNWRWTAGMEHRPVVKSPIIVERPYVPGFGQALVKALARGIQDYYQYALPMKVKEEQIQAARAEAEKEALRQQAKAAAAGLGNLFAMAGPDAAKEAYENMPLTTKMGLGIFYPWAFDEQGNLNLPALASPSLLLRKQQMAEQREWRDWQKQYAQKRLSRQGVQRAASQDASILKEADNIYKSTYMSVTKPKETEKGTITYRTTQIDTEKAQEALDLLDELKQYCRTARCKRAVEFKRRRLLREIKKVPKPTTEQETGTYRDVSELISHSVGH